MCSGMEKSTCSISVTSVCRSGRTVFVWEGSVNFSKYTKKKTFKLRFQLYLRVRVNSFAKTIVLEEDKNIVPPLWKMEKGIRLLALTPPPLHLVHVIYMPCVILGDIKRFWLSCLIGTFGILAPRYF